MRVKTSAVECTFGSVTKKLSTDRDESIQIHSQELCSLFKILKPTNINEETNQFDDLLYVFRFQTSSYIVFQSLYEPPAYWYQSKYQRSTYNIRKLEILA